MNFNLHQATSFFEEKLSSVKQSGLIQQFSGKKYLLIAAILLIVCIYFGFAIFFGNHFFPGTTINGVKCGGQTAAAMQDKYRTTLEGYTLTLIERDKQTETISGTSIGLAYVQTDSISSLLAAQNGLAWPVKLFGSKPATLPDILTYDQDELDSVMSDLACFQDENLVPSVNASVQLGNRGYYIEEEVYGTALKYDETRVAVEQAIIASETKLDLDKAQLYDDPTVLGNDAGLKTKLQKIKSFKNVTISFDFNTSRYDAVQSDIAGWINDDGVTYDEQAVYNWVHDMAIATDTYGGPFEFTTHSGAQIVLSTGGNYGYLLDKEQATALLIAALEKGKTTTIAPPYVYEGITHEGNGIGNTYVEISIEAQTMWCYKDGELVVETPIVSGDGATGYDTPSGCAWNIYYKERDAHFNLTNADVSYWMPFNGDCGLHDAWWRDESEYGGETYLGNGSHGCINTPFAAVEKIYNTVEVGCPVIVYYSESEVSGPMPTKSVGRG